MSCQQVPRLTEDPYTFTETTSSAVTATLFNPQIHKLTPIISSTNQTNSKVITTRTQQQQQQQQQHHQQIVTTSNRLIQQHFNARINGITQISNGIHKNVITTNQQTLAGGTTTTNQKFLQNQQQQQLQLQYQQFQQVGKITVNNTIGTTTKKFLPSQSPTTITVHQSHPLYSLAKQNSILTSGISQQQQQQQQQQSISSSSLPIVTTTVTTNIPLPPLFQRNIISRLPLASSSSSLPSSVSSAILTTGISGIVTQQQQQQQQQKTNIIPQPLNRIAQKNHSNQIIHKTSSVVSGIRNIPSQHQQIHGYNVVSTNFGTSQLNTIGLSGINGSIRNNNSINNNNSNIGNVNNVLNNNNNINNNNNNSNIRKHSINPTIVNPININQNSEIPTKRKTLETDSTIFITPAKRDTKVSSSQTSAVVLTTTTTTSAGKKTLPTKTQSSLSLTSKRKRSYSQTTHHEALQRISGITTLSSSSLSLPTQSGGGSTSINSNTIEWHAPDSYIFDSVSPTSSLSSLKKSENYDILSCIQSHWLKIADVITFIPTSSSITREQRIELRKVQLRRQAIQYASAQKFRTLLNARKRLICVSKALRKLRERDEIQTPRKCCFSTCTNESLALTAYCYLHITRNTDQYLFLPCTAKFSDNSQCRVPVFDISHELPLCREHAWKRDNYNRILQEQKPKKSPRKRPKPSAMTRPQKRNKKKRKPLMNSNNTMLTTTITNSILDDDNTNSGGGGGHHISGCADDDDDDDVTIDGGVINNVNCDVSMIGSLIKKIGYQMKSEKHDEINYIISAPQQTTLPTKIITQTGTTQDLLGICDNSSAYESSEDTGVGGLSESELIVGAHDVIEEIPLGDTRLLEEHDLTNVLNQLPVDAFNELFTTVQQNGPLEPTQEEQEDLERALEAVNKQVKSLQQMTGGGGGTDHDTAFLGDFLDVDDQILDDSDICTEVGLHSPNSNGELDTNSTILSDNNGTTRSNTRGNDLRGLVQT